MAEKRHDNGAVDAPEKKMKKKSTSSKLDAVMKELAEVKSSNVMMKQQLEKAQETIKSLQASLQSPRSEGDVESVEFNGNAGPSSTRRQINETGTELTRFMSSMNQMSISSIRLPECKPSVEGEQVGRRDFEAWKDLLLDSLKLAGVDDEPTQFVVFKVKAGPMLLEIYKNTKSTSEAPSDVMYPFSNALFRLKAYFGSASDIMLQRRKLAVMAQRPEETDLSFIMRVGAIARLCDFAEGKEFEEIISTVAEHARNKQVRTVALKMLSRQGSFTDLVDKVREIEAVTMNEEFYHLKHGKTDHAMVAAVSVPYATAGPSRQGSFRGSTSRARFGYQYTSRGGNRFRTPYERIGLYKQQEYGRPDPYRCFRCNSVYHKPESCFAIDKVCLNCGRKGHIQRACRTSMQKENERLTDFAKPNVVPSQIAAIEQGNGTKAEDPAVDKNVGDITEM
ncbi:uncharacterized protein LOC129730619 isoform X1 [Wyeomyia smithii]|uniref:uncharacterized protein LOC129730619 isoform X1 n=2 Tax=Wyeomyia smithii TaxID=174621 RepID=UPI002467C85C|nr:uncharacterized protein LOC129730619 isoform X1 [Wyeomyia smithii]